MPATGRQAALTDSEGWTLSLGSGARMAVLIDALVRLPGTALVLRPWLFMGLVFHLFETVFILLECVIEQFKIVAGLCVITRTTYSARPWMSALTSSVLLPGHRVVR